MFSGEKLIGVLKAGWQAARDFKDEILVPVQEGRIAISPFVPGAIIIPEPSNDEDVWGDPSGVSSGFFGDAADVFKRITPPSLDAV